MEDDDIMDDDLQAPLDRFDVAAIGLCCAMVASLGVILFALIFA